MKNKVAWGVAAAMIFLGGGAVIADLDVGEEDVMSLPQEPPARPRAVKYPNWESFDQHPLRPGESKRIGDPMLTHILPIDDFAVSPDGKSVGLAMNHQFYWHHISILDTSSWNSLGNSCALARDPCPVCRSELISCVDNGYNLSYMSLTDKDENYVSLWNPKRFKYQHRIHDIGLLSQMEASSDGKVLLLLSADCKTLAARDAIADKELWTLAAKDGLPFKDFSLARDGKTLVTINGDRRLEVRNVADGAVAETLADCACDAVMLCAEGPTAFYLDRQAKTIAAWDLKAKKKLWQLPSQGSVFCPTDDGKFLAVAGAREVAGTLEIIDVAQGKSVRKVQGVPPLVKKMATFPGGHVLAMLGWGSSFLRFVDLDNGTQLLKSHQADWPSMPVERLAISPDDKLLAEGYTIGAPITVRNLATGEIKWQVWPEDQLADVAFSPDGKYLACGVGDAWALRPCKRRVFLLDAASGKMVRQSQELQDSPNRITFSPDGKTIATVGTLPKVGITFVDVESGKIACTMPTTEYSHCDKDWLEYSPDGQWLGAQSIDRRFWLIDARSRKLVKQFKVGDYGCHGGVFTADSKTLLATCSGQMVVVDVAKKEIARTLKIGGDNQLVLSPDGRLVATCGRGEVSVSDVATGENVMEFEHGCEVRCAAWSHDGKLLVSGGNDETIRYWIPVAYWRETLGPEVCLTAQDLWDVMTGDDVAKSYGAAYVLSDMAADAVELAKHVQPVDADANSIPKYIADLDSNAFAARQDAKKKLAALGALASADMQQTLDNKPSAEVAKCLGELLAAAKADNGSALRVAFMLELIGNDSAIKELQRLAKGSESAALTQAAASAVARLAKRRELVAAQPQAQPQTAPAAK